jgi:hypothetical protein
MHKDAHLLDWATAIAGAGGPTWLEIVASHAQLLSVSDTRKEMGSSRADESRQWMKRIRPEITR